MKFSKSSEHRKHSLAQPKVARGLIFVLCHTCLPQWMEVDPRIKIHMRLLRDHQSVSCYTILAIVLYLAVSLMVDNSYSLVQSLLMNRSFVM